MRHEAKLKVDKQLVSLFKGDSEQNFTAPRVP